VAKPPGWDRSYTECWGFTLEDLGEAGATSIEQRLRAVGLPLDDIPGFPMPMDLPPRERALRGQKLLRAGIIGPGDEGVRQDPEAIEIMFDTLRRQAITDGVRPGTTIEWDFADSAPWHLVLENGRSRAAQGHAPRADLTLRCRFADWADLMSGRRDPRRLVLTRRVRLKGSPRVMLALPKVFG
jgi:hypothetical protein